MGMHNIERNEHLFQNYLTLLKIFYRLFSSAVEYIQQTFIKSFCGCI